MPALQIHVELTNVVHAFLVNNHLKLNTIK